MSSRFAEQLAAAAAGDVGPLEGSAGEQGSGAPPALGHAEGRAVPAGQQRQRPVGEGQAPAGLRGADHQLEGFQGNDHLGGPLVGDAQHSGQVLEGDPGPVGHQVDGALLGGPERCGQKVVGDGPPRTLYGEVGGDRGPLRLRLFGKLAAGSEPVQGVTQADGVVDRLGAPYRIVGRSLDRLALDGEEHRRREAVQHPAGVPEAHRVGHEDQDGPGQRPAAQLPHPVGEGGAVGGVSPPDDAHGAPVGKLYGGVQGRGPVPAKPDGIGHAGEDGGQPVYRGQGVQALHQDAPPAVGDGLEADQLVQGDALLGGQPFQPGGGEVNRSVAEKRPVAWVTASQ